MNDLCGTVGHTKKVNNFSWSGRGESKGHIQEMF